MKGRVASPCHGIQRGLDTSRGGRGYLRSQHLHEVEHLPDVVGALLPLAVGLLTTHFHWSFYRDFWSPRTKKRNVSDVILFTFTKYKCKQQNKMADTF